MGAASSAIRVPTIRAGGDCGYLDLGCKHPTVPISTIEQTQVLRVGSSLERALCSSVGEAERCKEREKLDMLFDGDDFSALTCIRDTIYKFVLLQYLLG